MLTRMHTARGFEHPRVIEQDKNIHTTSRWIIEGVKEGKSHLKIVSGTMAAGKSSSLALAIQELGVFFNENAPNRKIHLRSLKDGREKLNRNGIEIENGILDVFNGQQAVALIEQELILGPKYPEYDFIKPGDVIFLSEAQFGGGIAELERLEWLCAVYDLTIVCDCLATWFTGVPIAETELIKTLSYGKGTAVIDYLTADDDLEGYNSVILRACDSFNPEHFGDVPMRVVKIYEDGILHDEKDARSAHAYIMMSEERRREIFQAAHQNISGRIHQNEFLEKLIGRDEYGRFVLVPADPELDDGYVPGGNERYFPTRLDMIIFICDIAGLPDQAQKYRTIKGQLKQTALEA